MFLMQKRDGSMKVWECADGHKQRAYTEKIDAALPTTMTESIFTTAAIEAKEGKDVTIIH